MSEFTWEENREIIDWSCVFENTDKYNIRAIIENNNQAGPVDGIIQVRLKSKEPIENNKNIFIFTCRDGGSYEDCRKSCEEFYLNNLKDKEITQQYLLRLHVTEKLKTV